MTRTYPFQRNTIELSLRELLRLFFGATILRGAVRLQRRRPDPARPRGWRRLKRLLLRAVGFRYRVHRTLYFKWGTLFLRPAFELGVSRTDETISVHITLFGPGVSLRKAYRSEPVCDMVDQWGIYYDVEQRCLHLNWRERSKLVFMPWSWEHVRYEIMRQDGTLRPFVFQTDWDPNGPCFPDDLFVERHRYRVLYPADHGYTYQQSTATITVEEREWRWRWLMHWRWPRLVRRSIDIHFDPPIGPKGTVSTSYAMRPGERPIDTLCRMEREYRF